MVDVYLGLGANLGDRAGTLGKAVAALSALGELKCSQWHETEAVGLPGAPSFLNGAARLRTGLEPERLLSQIVHIEARLGRDMTNRHGSRTIDIDMLLYGNRVINTPELTVPHPWMHERAFVLVPLAELAPDVVHPVFGRTVRELLSQVSTAGVRPWSRP